MIFLQTSSRPPNFQQPSTSSGLNAPLDWAVFITLLLLIAWTAYRQTIKSGNADQKVLEALIDDLRTANSANSTKLSEIVALLSTKRVEEESILFRMRANTDQLGSISQLVAEQRTEIQLMERELAALHRRFDLSNMPSRPTQIEKNNG